MTPLLLPQIECIARAEPGPIGSVSETELQNLDVARSTQAETQAVTQPATVAAGSSPQATAAVGQKVLPKNERSDVLHELVSEGWLAESPDRSHHYSLGVCKGHPSRTPGSASSLTVRTSDSSLYRSLCVLWQVHNLMVVRAPAPMLRRRCAP